MPARRWKTFTTMRTPNPDIVVLQCLLIQLRHDNLDLGPSQRD